MKRISFVCIVLSFISCSDENKDSKDSISESLENLNRRNSSWIWVENKSGINEWIESEKFDTTNISGKVITFFDNGEIYSQSILVKGIEDTLKMHDTNGTLTSTRWYTEEGWRRIKYEKAEQFTWYYQNLNIKKTGNIIEIENNKIGNREFLNGEIITYYQDGDTASIEHFVGWEFREGEFKTLLQMQEQENIKNSIKMEPFLKMMNSVLCLEK